MRHDQASFRLVPALSPLPMCVSLGPVIDLVEWRMARLAGSIPERPARTLLILRIASCALDRIVELAGGITIRGASATQILTLPLISDIRIDPGEQRSILIEVTGLPPGQDLQLPDQDTCNAELHVSLVTYEDGSIEHIDP